MKDKKTWQQQLAVLPSCCHMNQFFWLLHKCNAHSCYIYMFQDKNVIAWKDLDFAGLLGAAQWPSGSIKPPLVFPLSPSARALPLTPEDVGAGVECVLQLKAWAQGGHVTPTGSPSPQQTVRGRGGRQRAAAVAGGRRHQLPSRQKREGWNDSFWILADTPKGCDRWAWIVYLHIAQTLLQVGDDLGELRPVLQWKLLVNVPVCFHVPRPGTLLSRS